MYKQPLKRNTHAVLYRTCLISRLFCTSLIFFLWIFKHCYSYLGFFSFFFQDDLSYNKTATQSTTPSDDETKYGAGNAVDRNTQTCMRTIEIGRSSPDKTVWWKVDVGGVYSIYSINIIFKNYDGFGKSLLSSKCFEEYDNFFRNKIKLLLFIS